MKFSVLVSGFLLSVVALAHGPSPLLADDGRDLSYLLKRYDGPVPILRRTIGGKRHAVPRTLQVEEVGVRKAPNGLVERQACLDPGYLPCTGYNQCCPAGTVCGPASCCLVGKLPCGAGKCCPDATGDCCSDNNCCPAGYVCSLADNGDIGCCPRGQICSGNISGCADKTSVECPGETFCCPPGQTCARDALGNATCLNSANPTRTYPTSTYRTSTYTTSTYPTSTYPNTIANINTNTYVNNEPTVDATNSPTNTPRPSGGNSNNPLDNIRSAALPQVAVTSGLMVTVAFLSAFLL